MCGPSLSFEWETIVDFQSFGSKFDPSLIADYVELATENLWLVILFKNITFSHVENFFPPFKELIFENLLF